MNLPLKPPAKQPDASIAHPRRGLVDWLELMGRDHGVLRLWWHNLHQVADGVWRSNQPTPGRIARYAALPATFGGLDTSKEAVAYSDTPATKSGSRKPITGGLGIRTIINLRGPRSDGGWRLEAEACARHGVVLEDFTIRSRAVPDCETIHAAAALFQRVEYPILIHCKSGADRAGIMAALYLLLMQGASVETAAGQLSFRFGHVRQAKTGLLDAFLAAYSPHAANGVSLLDWAARELDPAAITSGFMARRSFRSFWADRLTDSILRRE